MVSIYLWQKIVNNSWVNYDIQGVLSLKGDKQSQWSTYNQRQVEGLAAIGTTWYHLTPSNIMIRLLLVHFWHIQQINVSYGRAAHWYTPVLDTPGLYCWMLQGHFFFPHDDNHDISTRFSWIQARTSLILLWPTYQWNYMKLLMSNCQTWMNESGYNQPGSP